jgi:TonB-linked SusC/RagA family outer membrane protein
VTGEDDGLPLIGVNILVKGTSTGTVTDLDGNYKIDVPAEGTLIFSYTGYTPQEIKVANRSTIDVQMRAGAQLDEVVVTALGISRDRKALGYAVQELESEEITRVQQPNVVNALQGQVAGVQISANGGGPGQASRIIIRGITSLDPTANNQPLFVVDGIPISNETLVAGGDAVNRNVSNRAADLNPQDIETISVLKGGPATALYGLRAANGAVIITTKKGKAGKLQVDYTSSYGIEEVNKFPETQKTYTQGFAGVYDPNSFWPSWGPTVAEARQLDPDHPAEIFNNFENAYTEGEQFRNTLTFTGGNDKATFRTSLSHLDHDGVLPFSTYQNTSININANYQATERFSFGGGVNYIKSGGDRVFADRFNERLVYWAPQADVTDYIQDNGTMRGYRFDGAVGNNPIYGEFTNKWIDDVDRYLGNLQFSYSPVDFLTLNYTIGLDQYSDFRRNFAPGPRGLENEPLFENNGLGFVRETRIRSRQLTSNINAVLNFDLTNDLGMQILGGYDIFDSEYDQIITNGDELDIFDLYSLNNAAIITTSSFQSQYRLLGLYGDISFAYKDAIYLSITGRNDWSSALPAANRSFFYPSVSLGVGLSDLVTLPEAISYAKLRASFAAIGKDTDPYRTNVVYANAAGFPINNVTGWTRGSSKGSEDLVPERTTTYEVGADLRFFRNRLGLDITYYNSLSEDQIIPVPVSPTTGFTEFILNAGSIENRGVEAIVNISPISKPDFRWDVNINYTRNRNEVVAIRDGIEEIFLSSSFGYAGSSASIRLIEGQPYGNIYGRSYARYNPNPSDEPTLFIEDGPLLIGDNGFPVINTDQKILGNTQPDWFGAITNTFNYKNLSFSFMFDTRQGVQKYNQMDNFFSAFGIAPYTLNRNETIVFDGVTANGEPNTQEVWLGQGTGPDGVNYGAGYYRNVYRGITENSVEDADWIRLRNVSLSYQLPGSWLEGVFIERASITLTGNNLWLDTPYSGFDPEGNRGNRNIDDGFGGFTYPGVRSYFVNLNVTF